MSFVAGGTVDCFVRSWRRRDGHKAVEQAELATVGWEFFES